MSYGLLNPLQSLLGRVSLLADGRGADRRRLPLGGWRPAVTTVVCEAVILGTGLWHDSMVTLTMTLVATLSS